MEILTADQIKRLVFEAGKRLIDKEVLHKEQDNSDFFQVVGGILESNKENDIRSNENHETSSSSTKTSRAFASSVKDENQNSDPKCDPDKKSVHDKEVLHRHESLYKHNVEKLLESCSTDQQQRVIREVVQNTKKMELKARYALLENVKETFNLKTKPVDIPLECIESLQKEHNKSTDDRLTQIFGFYRPGTIGIVLEKIGLHGSNLNMRHSPMLNEISTACKNLKCKTPKFSHDVIPNASRLNSRLTHYVMGRGLNKNPTVFDALSLHFAQDESLSTTLKVLTYKELQENTELLAHYCDANGYIYSELPSQIFDASKFAQPPVLSLLAKTLQKNIVVHWGSYAVPDNALSFGNPKNPQAHLITTDGHFYPVYKIGTEPNPELNFHPYSCRSSKVSEDLHVLKPDLTEFVTSYSKPCNFCQAYKQQDCTHITNKQIEDVEDFRRCLLNPNLGSKSAIYDDKKKLNTNVTLPSWLTGKVVTQDVSMDNSCLYNGISVSLTGTEELALPLRKAIAADFLKNENHYIEEFSAMKYNAEDLVNLRKNIFSNQSWGKDENILLASKITSRKIIVYSYVHRKTFYECTQMYDLNPEQSSAFNPIILICKDRFHFEPAVPYNWEDIKWPTLQLDQFRRFKAPGDTVISLNSQSVCAINATETGNDMTPSTSQHHTPLKETQVREGVYSGTVDKQIQMAASIPDETNDILSEANEIKRNNVSANQISNDESPLTNLDYKEPLPIMSDDLQASEIPYHKVEAALNPEGKIINEEAAVPSEDMANKIFVPNISANDMSEFLTILEPEIDKLVRSRVNEVNIQTFTNNIMNCEAQFWKCKIKLLAKYKKHPQSAINKRSSMYHKFCRTDAARNCITSSLMTKGVPQTFTETFHKCHLVVVDTAKFQIGKRGNNIRERDRLTNIKCDYKPRTKYQEYELVEDENLCDQGHICQQANVSTSNLVEGVQLRLNERITTVQSLEKHTIQNALGENAVTKNKNDAANTLVHSFHPIPPLLNDEDGSTNFNASASLQTEEANFCSQHSVDEKNNLPSFTDSQAKSAYGERFGEQDEMEKDGEDILISDDGDSDWETIEICKELGYEKELKYVPPTEFSVLVPSKHFSSVFNYNTERFIPREWPNVISKYINKTQKCCSFTAERQPTYYAKKSKNGFCKLQGHCDCKIKFVVRIEETPQIGKSVKCEVVSSGTFKLIQNKSTGRQLRAGARRKMGRKLKPNKPIKVLTMNNNKMRATPHRLLHNNHPQKSKDVLSTLRSENVKRECKSANPREDVFLFAKEAKENDKLSKFVKGYVHHNNEVHGEITVHLYTEQSLKLLSSCCRNSKVTLHLDATGSVVKSPNDKQMLLYTIVAHTSSEVSFTVADMLSQRGRGVDIGHFLQKLKHDYKEVGASSDTPFGHVIVTDFSFAMLNGTSFGANGMRLKGYINLTWDIQNNRKTLDPDQSVLYICTSHLVKAVSTLMSKHIPNAPANKELKNLAVNSVVRMHECTDLMQLRETMEKICRIFGNKTLTSEEIEINKTFLTSKTRVTDSSSEVHTTDFEIDSSYHSQLFKSSPYYHMFKSVKERYTCDEVAEEEMENPFYNSKVLDVIGNHYAPYVSLYSSMMLHKTQRSTELRLTNAAVECDFKNVKNYLHDEGKTQYNTFIRRHFDFQQGRLVNVIPASQRKKATAVKLKRLQKTKSQNSDLHEEAWSRRKTPKKNKYVANKTQKAAEVSTRSGAAASAIGNDSSNDHKPKQTNKSQAKSSNIELPTPDFKSKLTVEEQKKYNDAKNERRKIGTLTNIDLMDDELLATEEELGQIYNDLVFIEETFEEYRKFKSDIANLDISKDSANPQVSSKTPQHDKHTSAIQSSTVLLANKETGAASAQTSKHAVDRFTRFGLNQFQGDLGPDGFLTYNDIQYMVNPKNKMDDKHVDFYMSLITTQHPETPFVITKSHFAHKSVDLDHKSKVKPYTWQSTRQNSEIPYDTLYLQDYSDTPYILHPLKKCNHWILLGLDKSSQVCIIFDSGRSSNKKCQDKAIQEIKTDVLPTFLVQEDNAPIWNVIFDNSFGKQIDGNSCGIFCISAAEEIVKRNIHLTQFVTHETHFESVLGTNFDPTKKRFEQVRNILSTTPAGRNVLHKCGNDDNLLQAHFKKVL